ncbi:MAG: translational GTPase TypA [Bacteroidota bacterium]|nr:translational GTPase TypA [Bacteroidota bacterium]MDP4233813.1 translational GTPase TypA [Bacteroidota bacterium]MDP4289034.1 translational GTPase TypA [Bacteroidota bacterium]
MSEKLHATSRDDIRNIAIIAHVDHGKTTLVDMMLRQSGTFRSNEHLTDRVMDSNDLEREKGITIMAKNTSVHWGGKKINIVDTPGHADFGGEVERILKMVDGVLLLVDAAEGCLPQTKFVLKKSLELHLKPIVVINKIDRKDARPEEVLDEVFELFMSLGANYEQLEFPIVYAVGKNGLAGLTLKDEMTDLAPLFRMIIDFVPAPPGEISAPFQMLVANVDWSDYLGRLAVGRIFRGTVREGDWITRIRHDGTIEKAKISKLYTFEGLKRVENDAAAAGEIVQIAGLEDVKIGETLTDPEHPEALPIINVDEPTISMNFVVNDSPLAGREGKFVTSRHIRERLMRELRKNISIRVEELGPDTFKVAARGELQLAIMIETMRREGYEFAVSKPEVIMQVVDGDTMEPIEDVVIDVPDEYVGGVIEALGIRKGQMVNMSSLNGHANIEYHVPSRGMIGFRGEFLTMTRGTGLLNQVFYDYESYKGPISGRTRGALISLDDGDATPYAMEGLQERSVFFIPPGTKCYKGMIVGENSREEDMVVNVTKKKHLTNMRASGSDGAVQLDTPRMMSLEQQIEWLSDDEYLEITPESARFRKKILDPTERHRTKKRAEQMVAA